MGKVKLTMNFLIRQDTTEQVAIVCVCVCVCEKKTKSYWEKNTLHRAL